MFRIKGGTKQVITALCSSFDHEARVKLGDVVTSMSSEKDEARVKVKTDNGSTKVIFLSHILLLHQKGCVLVRSCDVG